MSRLVVVLPLAPLRTGESFAVTHWPLHVTVLAPFSTGATLSEVTEAIKTTMSDQVALTAVAGPVEMFGRRHNIPVTVLADNPALTSLHRMLVDGVRPLASTPEEPAFTGREFRAHVTIKQHARIQEGAALSLSQIAVVDMAPRSHPGGRSVLATLPLRPLPPIGGPA
jgi:2'-5' RNA ligase